MQDIKSRTRQSVKIFGTGHTKTNIGSWKSCNFPVAWTVLLENRFIKIEGWAETVKSGSQAAMFTKVSVHLETC